MKRKNYRYYRSPKTLNEAKASQDCEYVRAKRRPHNLPNGWDDQPHCTQKSWKVKRRKQYREKPRGKKHEMFFEDLKWRVRWELQEYFDEHNIPYHIEDHRETYDYTYEVSENVKDYQVPWYTEKYRRDEDGKYVRYAVRQSGYRWIYKTVKTGKFKTVKRSVDAGTTLRWWSDKDIGVEYIMARAMH